MSEYGFVQNLSPVDYAHLLQGENLKNGQFSGTITEIDPKLVATTTTIQGVVTDGKPNVTTKLSQREWNQYFKNIYETFLAKNDVGTDEKLPFLRKENERKNKKGTNSFEEEKATHTLIVVTKNNFLEITAAGREPKVSRTSNCRRFRIYSLMTLAPLLVYSGGIAICHKWEFSVLWFSLYFIGISVIFVPMVFWALIALLIL